MQIFMSYLRYLDTRGVTRGGGRCARAPLFADEKKLEKLFDNLQHLNALSQAKSANFTDFNNGNEGWWGERIVPWPDH